MDNIKNTRGFSGFTLVELIVVITILVILGTIAFIQLQGFSGTARDGRRVSDMSNITKAIDLAIIAQGNAPIPANPTSYTGWLVTIQVGTVTNTTIPKMSGDFSDPLTKGAYNYSVLWNGSYYQLGIDFENPIAYIPSYHESGIGWGLMQTVYADTAVRYSKLSGNYTFDPSLPSLFVLSGTINSASGGIFSPDVCFIMNNLSTNTFASTPAGCVMKKDMALKNLDSGLVGYWDMETLTSNGLLKDLSGNGWNGKCYNDNNESSSGSCLAYWPPIVSWGMSFDGLWKSVSILNSTGILAWEKQMTLMAVVDGNCDFNDRNCIVLRTGFDGLTVKSLNYAKWKVRSEVSVNNNSNYTNLVWTDSNTVTYRALITSVYNGNSLKIFRDGQLVWERSLSGVISNSTSNWFIWKAYSVDNATFSGTISEVKIYNRTLSDSEIRQHVKTAGL